MMLSGGNRKRSQDMSSILIIGAASLDTLHIREKTYSTAGGAGLYTALAANVAGAATTLFAPKPDPMPAALQPMPQLIRWIGPTVDPDQLSRLEIAHHGNGKATLVDATWGAVERLSPNDLPANLARYDVVHIAALPSAQMQLGFLHACRQRSAATISVGTYARVVTGETETVRALLAESDLFFMNQNEAEGLFGSLENATAQSQQTVFVTLDKDGAVVIQQSSHQKIAGTPVEEVDPTGAGDTFCGATLAGIVQGQSVAEAAQDGCQLAAKTVQAIGPSGFIRLSE